MGADARVMVLSGGMAHVFGQGQAIQAALMAAALNLANPAERAEINPTTLEDVAYVERHLAEHIANDHGGDASQCHVKVYRHDLQPEDTAAQLSEAERAAFEAIEQGYAQG